jgi:membrane protein required for colicin V production
VNWIDAVAVLIMILFLVAGARKGFIREATGLVAIILAFILGITGAPIWSEILVEKTGLPNSLATLIAFLLIFILVFILIRALGGLLFRVIRATPLDILDRLGGSLFGLLKGALVISLVLVLLGLFTLPQVVVQEMDGSAAIPPLRAVAPAVYNLLKGVVPQMRSLGEVVGESVEEGFFRGREEILERSSQMIDKLQESKSGNKKDEPSETSPGSQEQ